VTFIKNRTILIAGCLISSFFAARSQDAGRISIGLEGGLSNNIISTNISNRVSTILQYNTGYTIGIPVQYRITNWLGVEAASNIMQKNYTISRTDSLTGVYQQFNNTYLQLPLTARFTYGWRRIQFFANLGGYVGYWAGSRISGRVPDILSARDSIGASGQSSESILLVGYDRKYQFDSRRDARLEFGWVAGAGVQYLLKDKYDFFARCNYYYALTNQQKDDYKGQTPQYNETFAFTLGAMVTLGKN